MVKSINGFDSVADAISSHSSQLATIAINVKSAPYNAKGDGIADDTTAIQNAINAAVNGTVFFPDGTYKITQSLVIPSNIHVVFSSYLTTIKYLGTGDAIQIYNQKHVFWEKGTVDISGAGANSNGIHIAGLWYGTFISPNVIKGPTNSIGILVETSAPNTTTWGAYIIRIQDFQSSGTGQADIRARQTAGDNVAITHLTINGGWTTGGASGVYLENVDSGFIKGITCEGGDTTNGSAIYIGSNCNVIYLDGLGEMDSYKHGITINGGNYVYIIGDNPNGNISDINIVNGTVNRYGKNNLRMNPSPGYFAEWHTDLNYGLPVRLNVSGGGGAFDIIQWGDNAGLTLDGANANPIHLNTKPDFKGGTATTVGAAGTAAALPSAPVGYILIEVSGTNYKLPYYNV